MLNKLDDYPIHQTPEPIAHPATGDRNAYDRYFFNGYTREADLFFGVAMGLYPNRRVLDAAISVVRGGIQYQLRASRLAPLERTETSVGPISVEIVEPMRAQRLRIAPNPHGIEGELLFRARTEALEEPRITVRSGTRTTMDSTRFTQFGTWEGWLSVGDERIQLDPRRVLGTRDRSWGVRGVGEPEGGAPSTALAQFFWLWAPLHFEDLCTHFQVNEYADGHAWKTHGVVLPLLDTGKPLEEMKSVQHSIQWESGTRRAKHARITLVPRAGEPHVIELEPLLTFQMRGIGYFDPEWAHGTWKGELAVGGSQWKLADVKPMEPWHLHIQALCRLRMGNRVGIGALEQLVLGPHTPSGFTSILDPAP